MRWKFHKNNQNDAYFKAVGSEKVVHWVVFAVLLLFALTLLYPLIFILLNSFKTQRQYTENFYAFPSGLEFINYYNALTTQVNESTMINMFGNSLFLVTCSTLLTVFFSSCSAYIMSKYEFRLKSVIYGAVIFSLILPIVGSMPVMVKLFRETIPIYDTPFVILFIYSGGFGTNFLLLYSFFKSISWSYAEAAQIDGAGDFTVFIRIMLPIALPAMASVTVLTWIGLWNEYVIPLVFLPSMPTIAVGIESITTQLKAANNFVEMYAAIILTLIPITIVFLLFQKTLMTNTVVGGLKG